MAENKPSFGFTALNPPWVFGPSLNPLTNLDKLNESSETIWNLVNGSLKTLPANDFLGFVDAEDLGHAHLLAFENKDAAGERFIIGSHFDYQSAVDILNDGFPELKGRIPVGDKGATKVEDGYQLDASKAKKVLGVEFTSLRKTLINTVNGLLQAEKSTAWVKK
jgi:nucleoside-diphosphate-sugar epimerase